MRLHATNLTYVMIPKWSEDHERARLSYFGILYDQGAVKSVQVNIERFDKVIHTKQSHKENNLPEPNTWISFIITKQREITYHNQTKGNNLP